MAQTFNLADYETVEERLRRFWADPAHSDARIVTLNHTTPADRSVNTWVVEARIYLSAGDQANDLPKATGWAFEVDGSGMTQRANALETCETSAIGRCLANMNLSGNKRASREEMEKAQRGVTPLAPRNWMREVDELKDVDGARQLYNEARTRKAGTDVLEAIKAKVASLGA